MKTNMEIQENVVMTAIRQVKQTIYRNSSLFSYLLNQSPKTSRSKENTKNRAENCKSFNENKLKGVKTHPILVKHLKQ